MDLDLNTIIQGGAVGISIALIILLGFVVRIVYKLASNHMEHSTEAFNRNTDMLGQVKTLIDSNMETDKTVLKVCDRISKKLDNS